MYIHVDYFIGLDFLGNNFNINVVIIICIFPPGANFLWELWSCDIGTLSSTCGNWMNVSCMRANRAAGRQVKIMGKPGVKADKWPEYIQFLTKHRIL